MGIPFDAGCTYRTGARFGPSAIRQASRILRPYHVQLQTKPFTVLQVADAGDMACNPFNIQEAIKAIEKQADALLASKEVPTDQDKLALAPAHPVKLLSLGGDHTVALPLLRAVNKRFGQVALLHFDAHLDTWDTYFGEPFTHGTPFRRASEEKLFDSSHSMHVGIRGPIYDPNDLIEDEKMGFRTIHCDELEKIGVRGAVQKIRNRIGGMPLYISIDIDVLDPAHAPGTGTPEIGGLTTRELQGILRGLKGLNVVSCDIVETSPSYDHAEITSLAAAGIAYELLGLMSAAREGALAKL